MATSSAESEIFGIVLESIPAGANSTISRAAWECLGGSHPRCLSRRFNAVCYYLPSAPALPADSIRNPSSGATVYNQEVKINFLSCPAHTHTCTNSIWKYFVNFFSRLFFCCLQVSQHNSVRLYQDPELAIL